MSQDRWKCHLMASLGQGVIAPGARMESWAVSRAAGALEMSRDIRAPECTQGLKRQNYSCQTRGRDKT